MGSNSYAQKNNGKGNLPIFSFYNPNKLAKAICKNASTDEEKVRAISNWITYHIKYDCKRFVNSDLKRYSSKRVLFRKHAMCDEYSVLFNDLCQVVNVKSFSVEGYSKGFDFELDDTLYTPDHMWNMVKVDESWHLMDLTFASGYSYYGPSFWERLNVILFRPVTCSKLKYVKKRDSTYLLSNPQKFVINHLPSIPEFQNLDQPISLYDFQNCLESNCPSTDDNIKLNGSPNDWFSSTEKDRRLWQSNGAVNFNIRNQITKALDYQIASYQNLVELGYNPKSKELPNDLAGLKLSMVYLDSSMLTIPVARAFIQEEYYSRKYKNQYRHKLARQTINPVLNQNKRVLSFSKKVPVKNKRKLKNYGKMDENLLIQKANLIEGSLQIIKLFSDTNSESFKNEFVYNEKQMNNFLDSALIIEKLIKRNIHIISDSLIPATYKKLSEIARFQDLICKLTSYSNSLRIHHYDNLDAELEDAQNFRILFNDSLKYAIWVRNQNMRESANLELDTKDLLAILKSLLQQTKAAVNANATLGLDNRKEYQEILQLSCKNIDSLLACHKVFENYYAYEINWAKPVLKKSRAQAKRLIAENAYENTRFKVKLELISNRNLSYKKLLTNLNKQNRANKTILKPQIKKLSKV
ncbi:MAG: hypothetical protein K9H61_01870 [Bacteroidia bacterium]|nr:hypothetical protein [Bacteroidia bacterium]MCF8427994.1 hypothetical protein [Bacteroidia bacterium]MCF8445718.1 hypothetical protein [Bacteroidia bacterium]